MLQFYNKMLQKKNIFLCNLRYDIFFIYVYAQGINHTIFVISKLRDGIARYLYSLFFLPPTR